MKTQRILKHRKLEIRKILLSLRFIQIQTYSQAAGHIKVKFHVEPVWSWGMKVCSNDEGYMAKMAAMPVCG